MSDPKVDRTRLVRRQGSADPPIHLGERDVGMEMAGIGERRLGMLPPTGTAPDP